jgi:hypothetical protein
MRWLGGPPVAAGVVTVGGMGVTVTTGGSPSINLGDPSKFHFILVPIWAIGVALAVAGGLCLVGCRLMKGDVA